MTEDIDLSKWTRVSNILSLMPSLSPAGNWEYPMQKIDPVILQRKADLGSLVHKAIAAHIKGGFVALSDTEQGYFNSYLRWEESVHLSCHEVEKRFFYEPMNLTGCVDMIAKINPNGIYHIIDFKCTVSPDHKKWPLQAAFYELLAQANKFGLDKRCLFVQLDSTGSFPKIHEYEITPNLTQMAVSLYNMYMYLTRN